MPRPRLSAHERRRKNGDGNATFTLGAGINTGMTARLSRLVARVSVSGIRTEFDPQRTVLGGILRTEKHLCAECRERSCTGHGRIQHHQNEHTGLSDRKLHRLQRNCSLSGKFGHSPVSVGTEHKTDYWFYILPNEETTRTALVLEGTFKKKCK